MIFSPTDYKYAVASESADVPYNYTNPQLWSSLSPRYYNCANYSKQSPIDFTISTTPSLDPQNADTSLPPIYSVYSPTGKGVGTIETTNFGTSLEVSWDHDDFIMIGDLNCKLKRLHFHSPSEHLIDGVAHDMEAHIVHNCDDDSTIVISVFLEVPRNANSSFPILSPSAFSEPLNEDSGSNVFLSKLGWDNLDVSSREKYTPVTASLNLHELLPSSLAYYHYEGSLTTPPCSPKVIWYVLQSPMSISARQLQLYKQRFGPNARPVQPINDRKVTRNKANALFSQKPSKSMYRDVNTLQSYTTPTAMIMIAGVILVGFVAVTYCYHAKRPLSVVGFHEIVSKDENDEQTETLLHYAERSAPVSTHYQGSV